jgi:uncharacterized damage-inducible protein DinB
MSEIARILDQLDRAYSGEAWHGPNLLRLLDGLSAEHASKHSIQGAHSIWELVNHIAAWNTIVQHELGGELMEISAERDWPPVYDASDIAWMRTLETLAESRRRLRKAVEGLRDDQLDEKPVSRSDNSRYLMLHGLVQHDLYHAGQIAVLKKAIA